ncbi:hypothetical protein, partial [Staphylococcus pasteuri_A]
PSICYCSLIRGGIIGQKHISLILIILVGVALICSPWTDTYEIIRRYLMLSLAILIPLYFLSPTKKDKK